MADHLAFLYGQEEGSALLPRLEALLRDHLNRAPAPPPSAGPLNQADAILITYGDQIRAADEPPLRTLESFLRRHLAKHLSGVHILPFFPYSSDDGFAVIDYRQVDPALGSWEDIRHIAHSSRLMVDAVINHISAHSSWFQSFLRGEAPYRDFFICVDPKTDLSMVVRPRDLPLLTPFETSEGVRHVWTTFSADQIDLNYANPEVLLAILDLLLFYVRQGAQIIRLDAIAYLWKEIGTTCIHLPQTHRVVKLIRAVMEAVAPWVYIITETNVPHRDNVAYFGDGDDEAHMVYQFPLPPLVLHTFTRGDASHLTAWAQGLQTPSRQTIFFNFLASHDGIGVLPARGILSDQQLQALIDLALARGGQVSYRGLGDGGKAPYELNITWFDALTDAEELERDAARAAARFLASQAVMLALAGVPGIYVHSLFGSRNDRAAAQRTGSPRAINRHKFNLSELEAALTDPASHSARIFRGYRHLLATRRHQPAFHPQAEQQIPDLGPGLFAVLRRPREGHPLLCLHEVRGERQTITLPRQVAPQDSMLDILQDEHVDTRELALAPYQVRWLAPGERP